MHDRRSSRWSVGVGNRTSIAASRRFPRFGPSLDHAPKTRATTRFRGYFKRTSTSMRLRLSTLCGGYCRLAGADSSVWSFFSSRCYSTSAIMSGIKRSADHLSSSAAADDGKKPKSNGSITSFFGAPKAKPAGGNGGGSGGEAAAKPVPSVVANFDKQKWANSLTPEQRELLQLEIDTMDESWLARLKDDLVTPDFLALKQFLKKEKESGVTVFPPEKDIYSWSRYTPLDNVKVVVVGQDPYHNYNQAHGLAFSVLPPTPAPKSLANIYIGIKRSYPSFREPPNKGGLLTPWAERGVLMLNTCLTVRAHNANSHSNKGWERLTQKIIDLVAKVRTRGVVFLAWGKPAGERVAKIDRQRHCILQSVHPSPLSAHRGFFDNGHFKKCNDWLAQRYGEDEIIDWNLVPQKAEAAAPAPAVAAAAKEAPSPLAETQSKPQSTSGKSEDTKPTPTKPAANNAGADDDDFEDDNDALEALLSSEANDPEHDFAQSKSNPGSKENDPPAPNETVSS